MTSSPDAVMRPLVIRAAPWAVIEALLARPPADLPLPWDVVEHVDVAARAEGIPGIGAVVVYPHPGPFSPWRGFAFARSLRGRRVYVLAADDGDPRRNVRLLAALAAPGRARLLRPDGSTAPLRAGAALAAEAARLILAGLLAPVAFLAALALALFVASRAAGLRPSPPPPRRAPCLPRRVPSTDLSLVIVSYNSREDLEPLLDGVAAAADGLRVETIVVDNASRDESAAFVRARYPNVEVVENGWNLGISAAVNMGLARARGRIVVAANADVVPTPGALRTIVAYLDAHPDVGCAGVRLVYPGGAPQRGFMVRRFPSVLGVAAERTLWRLVISEAIRTDFTMETWEADGPTDVEQPSGPFLAVRREILETVGGWDESIFLYFEDVDWCRRIRDAGWRLVHLPEAVVVHGKSRSFAGAPPSLGVEFHRSMVRYFERHEGAASTALLDLLFGADAAAAAVPAVAAAILGDRAARARAGVAAGRYLVHLGLRGW